MIEVVVGWEGCSEGGRTIEHRLRERRRKEGEKGVLKEVHPRKRGSF